MSSRRSIFALRRIRAVVPHGHCQPRAVIGTDVIRGRARCGTEHLPPASIPSSPLVYNLNTVWMELDLKYVEMVVQRWQTLSGREARREGDGRKPEKGRPCVPPRKLAGRFPRGPLAKPSLIAADRETPHSPVGRKRRRGGRSSTGVPLRADVLELGDGHDLLFGEPGEPP
jgi:hypothetical protein